MRKAGKQLSFNRFPQRHQVQRVLILVCTNFAFACRLSKEALVGYIWKYWKMCDAQLQILENVTRFFDCTVYSFCSCLYPGQHITSFQHCIKENNQEYFYTTMQIDAKPCKTFD